MKKERNIQIAVYAILIIMILLFVLLLGTHIASIAAVLKLSSMMKI